MEAVDHFHKPNYALMRLSLIQAYTHLQTMSKPAVKEQRDQWTVRDTSILKIVPESIVDQQKTNANLLFDYLLIIIIIYLFLGLLVRLSRHLRMSAGLSRICFPDFIDLLIKQLSEIMSVTALPVKILTSVTCVSKRYSFTFMVICQCCKLLLFKASWCDLLLDLTFRSSD